MIQREWKPSPQELEVVGRPCRSDCKDEEDSQKKRRDASACLAVKSSIAHETELRLDHSRMNQRLDYQSYLADSVLEVWF